MQNNKQYISMTQYDDFMKDSRKAYLLLESVQSYINDCINEYHKLNKDDEKLDYIYENCPQIKNLKPEEI